MNFREYVRLLKATRQTSRLYLKHSKVIKKRVFCRAVNPSTGLLLFLHFLVYFCHYPRHKIPIALSIGSARRLGLFVVDNFRVVRGSALSIYSHSPSPQCRGFHQVESVSFLAGEVFHHRRKIAAVDDNRVSRDFRVRFSFVLVRTVSSGSVVVDCFCRSFMSMYQCCHLTFR